MARARYAADREVGVDVPVARREEELNSARCLAVAQIVRVCRPVVGEVRHRARERARISVDEDRRVHVVIGRGAQRRLEIVVPADGQLLDTLARRTRVQVIHREAHQAARREGRRRVHPRTAVVAAPRLACKAFALCWRGHDVSEAPAARRVALASIAGGRVDRRIIAQLARVGRRTRRPHVYSKSCRFIRDEADLSESSVHAVATDVVWRVCA